MRRLGHGVVSSKDRTAIGYFEIGQGPALIILHGMMEAAVSHRELAEALSREITVCLPDRRGRGTSAATGAGYSMDREIEDVRALLDRTGARRLFGVSSGALLALQCALDYRELTHVAAFDPPLSVEGSVPEDWVERFEKELSQENLVAALVTAMCGTGLGPPILARLPRTVPEFLTRLLLHRDDKNTSEGHVPMRALARTILQDVCLVRQASRQPGQFSRLSGDATNILLLGGSNSPAYFKTALQYLKATIPAARSTTLRDAGHGASGNRNRGGVPAAVAAILRDFMFSPDVVPDRQSITQRGAVASQI